MKIVKIALFVLLLVNVFVAVVSAELNSAGLLGGDAILAEPIPQGKMDISADIAYSSASEILNQTLSPTGEGRWVPISDAGLDSVAYLYVPIRFTYGISDNLAVRLTLPYASLNMKPQVGTETKGSGLANIELEGLYRFFNDGEDSFSILLKYKNGAGKKMSELTTGEVYVGSRSNDLLLAGIGNKDFGSLKGKMLLGYLLTNSYTENMSGVPSQDFNVNLTDQVIYSLAIICPLSEQLDVSGELWGALSIDTEKLSINLPPPNNAVEFVNSKRDQMVFSPIVSYKVGDSLVLRGAADILISKSAAVTFSVPDMFKFTTYTIGGTLTL